MKWKRESLYDLGIWKYRNIARRYALAPRAFFYLMRTSQYQPLIIENTAWLPKTQISDLFLRIKRMQRKNALYALFTSLGYYYVDRRRKFSSSRFYTVEEMQRLKRITRLRRLRAKERRKSPHYRLLIPPLKDRRQKSQRRISALISRLSHPKKENTHS